MTDPRPLDLRRLQSEWDSEAAHLRVATFRTSPKRGGGPQSGGGALHHAITTMPRSERLTGAAVTLALPLLLLALALVTP